MDGQNGAEPVALVGDAAQEVPAGSPVHLQMAYRICCEILNVVDRFTLAVAAPGRTKAQKLERWPIARDAFVSLDRLCTAIDRLDLTPFAGVPLQPPGSWVGVHVTSWHEAVAGAAHLTQMGALNALRPMLEGRRFDEGLAEFAGWTGTSVVRAMDLMHAAYVESSGVGRRGWGWIGSTDWLSAHAMLRKELAHVRALLPERGAPEHAPTRLPRSTREHILLQVHRNPGKYRTHVAIAKAVECSSELVARPAENWGVRDDLVKREGAYHLTPNAVNELRKARLIQD